MATGLCPPGDGEKFTGLPDPLRRWSGVIFWRLVHSARLRMRSVILPGCVVKLPLKAPSFLARSRERGSCLSYIIITAYSRLKQNSGVVELDQCFDFFLCRKYAASLQHFCCKLVGFLAATGLLNHPRDDALLPGQRPLGSGFGQPVQIVIDALLPPAPGFAAVEKRQHR